MPESCEKLRRADRARRQDELGARGGECRRAVLHELDAGGTASVEPDALGLGAGENGQIGAPLRRPQEGLGRAPAHAAALIDLEIAAALVVAAIEVVGARDADLGRRGAEGVEDLPGETHLLDAPLAARAVLRVGAADEIFRAPEIGQHIGP